MVCFYHVCPSQELRPFFTEEDIKRGSKERELDGLRRHFMQDKGSTVIEMWECEWWRLYKTTTSDKLHIRENSPYRRSLTQQQLLEGIKKETYLTMSNATLMYPKTRKQTLVASLQYSRTL